MKKLAQKMTSVPALMSKDESDRDMYCWSNVVGIPPDDEFYYAACAEKLP